MWKRNLASREAHLESAKKHRDACEADEVSKLKALDAARTYKSGLHQFSGSMEVVYDDGHTAATNAFDPAQDGALTVEFYPDSTAGEKFTGSVIVTSVSRTASFDDLVTATVNFQGTGALTIGSV
jgi:predicted secreted protein